MSRVTLKRTGLDKLIRSTGDIAREGRKETLEALAEGARARVKIVSGETHDSIEVAEDGLLVGGGGLYLEKGTVHAPPQPFVAPTIDAVMREVPEKYGSKIREAAR